MRKAMILAILFCLVATTPVMAQEAQKIGVLSLRKILLESNAGKRAHSNLTSTLKPESEALKSEENQVKQLQEDYKKLAPTLSPEGKGAKARDIQKRMVDLQQRVSTFQQKAVEKEASLMNPIKEKLVEVIHSYAQRNKFTLVLTDAQGGVIYAASGIDITNEVLAEFNKAMP